MLSEHTPFVYFKYYLRVTVLYFLSKGEFQMKKRFLCLTVVLILSLGILTACSSSDQNSNTGTQNPTTQGGTQGMLENSNNPTDNAQNNQARSATNSATDNNTYNESRSKALIDAVSAEIAQAKDVWVMVVGNMAYVALDIPAEDTSTDTTDIKSQVSEIIMNADEDITDVYVLADADSFTRIKDTFADLTNGKPISGMSEEITNLFTRITPSRDSR